MTRKFEIGPGLHCDLDRLIASRLLIQANSGGGKTRTIRRLLEQTHGRVQHLVLDPEGEYHTLREEFDYVLAAPKGGDTVAHPRTAALLAERLLQLGVSAILDIYELNPDGRQAFVKHFLQALVNAPRELWHPVLVILDEAHVYAPEGKESESTAAVKAMASRGRKRGFCLVPATQRLAKLSKDVAAECNNKLIGRCTLDVDIKRAAEELGFTTNEQKQTLRQLEPGQFYGYGSAFDVREPRLVKVGSIRTTHPEPGQHAAPVPPPTDKVRKVLQQLADLPAEAEAREKSIEDLKRDNANLRRQLTESKSQSTNSQLPTPKEKRVEVLTDADRALLAKLGTMLEQMAGKLGVDSETILGEAEARLHNLLARLHKEAELVRAYGRKQFAELLEGKRFTTILEKLAAVQPHKHTQATMTQRVGAVTPQQRQPPLSPHGRRAVPAATASRPASVHSASSNGHLPPGEKATLIAAAQYPDGLTREQASILTGYKRSSRDAYIQRLLGKGYVELNGGNIFATDGGVAALGSDYEPLPTGEDLQQYWLGRLSPGEQAVLELAIAKYPEVVAREAIDDVTGYKRSSRDAYIQRLKARQLVTIERAGIAASAVLFES